MKEMLQKICIIIFALLSIIGCSKKNEAVTNSISSEKTKERTEINKFIPEFTITMNENDEGHLFTVQTNLPDTTELIVSLEDENNEEILAQDEDSVINGIASFGPFREGGRNGRPRGSKLLGKYIFVLTMPVMLVQNEDVKKVLGQNGENIESSLIYKFEELDSIGLEQKFYVDFDTGTLTEARLGEN